MKKILIPVFAIMIMASCTQNEKKEVLETTKETTEIMIKEEKQKTKNRSTVR